MSTTTKKKHPFLGWVNTYVFNGLYHLLILRFNNYFVWDCQTEEHIVPFFQRYLTNSQIEVGPAVGWYVSTNPFPKNTSLTLVDINPTSLRIAREAVERARPDISVQTVQTDLCDPSETPLSSLIPASRLPAKSLSIFYTLHCLPLSPAGKVDLLTQLGQLVDPDAGVVYGNTILGIAPGIPHNWIGKFQIAVNHYFGWFGNYYDTAQNLMEPLEAVFDSVEWHVQGTVLFFKLSGPKKGN